MKPIQAFDIETANARFELTISAKADGKGYVGEYFGTAPKFAQMVRPGFPTPMMRDVGSGKLEGDDLAKLIATCGAEIEKIDGKIQQTNERKM